MEDIQGSRALWNVKYWMLQAKIILGLSSSLKTEELQSEEIHEKFIQQLAMVFKIEIQCYSSIFVFKSSLPNSKIDAR